MFAMLAKPPLNLATTTTVLYLGISKLSYFKSDCPCSGKALSRLPTYLESRRLLSFIPSRYGRVASISHATNCLIARLGYIAEKKGKWAPEEDVIALKYYSK